MKSVIPTVSAAVIGAAAMYFLDPEQGRRRRALVRDKIVSTSLHTSDAARARSRGVASRLQGWTAGLKARLRYRVGSDDPRTLHHRVRARLGHAVSHPKAVHAEVMDDRTVCLSGNILASELDALLTQVERVPGVSRVDSRLTVHESAAHIPELQGHARRSASRGDSRVWRALAWAAPVAILAAAVRPTSRSNALAAGLDASRQSLPRLLARVRGSRRHFGRLHI